MRNIESILKGMIIWSGITVIVLLLTTVSLCVLKYDVLYIKNIGSYILLISAVLALVCMVLSQLIKSILSK